MADDDRDRIHDVDMQNAMRRIRLAQYDRLKTEHPTFVGGVEIPAPGPVLEPGESVCVPMTVSSAPGKTTDRDVYSDPDQAPLPELVRGISLVEAAIGWLLFSGLALAVGWPWIWPGVIAAGIGAVNVGIVWWVGLDRK